MDRPNEAGLWTREGKWAISKRSALRRFGWQGGPPQNAADDALKAARQEIAELRKLLACCLDEWYYEIHGPTDEAIQTKEAVVAALKGTSNE